MWRFNQLSNWFQLIINHAISNRKRFISLVRILKEVFHYFKLKLVWILNKRLTLLRYLPIFGAESHILRI